MLGKFFQALLFRRQKIPPHLSEKTLHPLAFAEDKARKDAR